MAKASANADLVERFDSFYRNYYEEAISELAQRYPNDQRSLYVDYDDLYRFDVDLAEDYRTQPEQMQEYAEEALRQFDLPADVKLGRAHVRLRNLSDAVDIRDIRVHDDHIGRLIEVRGIVRKATDVRPKVVEAAFECQRCGTMTYIPQSDGSFQEPHECQGCERQGPFRVNHDQSEFVDSQQIRVQESPEGLRGGETPQHIDVNLEDDVTGKVTAGDHVAVVGVLHIEQMEQGQEMSAVFDLYMDGVSVGIEDEQFEDMDISTDDVEEILALSQEPDIYDQMIDSIAPTIYGYEEEKFAMALQLFSGVTKKLPDKSRIRGDMHLLLIGDPGTGKCLDGDTRVTLADGREVPIRDLVESNLDDPKTVDDGVWDTADLPVQSMASDGSLGERRATKVWKREAPDRMYRVRTASGRELTVTPSHPLFVQAGGRPTAKRADELSAGEFVAAPRRLSLDGSDALDVPFRRSESNNAVRLNLPDAWTPSLARLVGYVVAEGYVERRNDDTGYVSITNDDREILDDVADALGRIGLNHTERQPHEGNSAREIICSAGEFVSFLAGLDAPLLEGSAEQRVPNEIMAAGDQTKRAFLRTFVEGEGHVSSSQREVTVASMSRDLLVDVRTLLVGFDIESQIQSRQNGSYRLRISGEDFERYHRRVGFVTERKPEAAAAVCGGSSNTNTDLVPVGDDLRDLRESLGLTQADCGLPRPTYQHYERGDRSPSRESLRQVVDAFDSALPPTQTEPVHADGGQTLHDRVESLQNLVDADVGWDRIESIEPVEPEDEWVYDLEVGDTHTYLSNGVVSHNSQMLSYIRKIAPRSVYTSGKGSSSAGLTAAAVRDDFGEGQQWTLEAGALVLADQGIAAVDELDKMRCVTGETLVHGPDGIDRIRDIAVDEMGNASVESLPNGRTIRDIDDREVWTMTEDGRLVTRPVEAVHEYEAPTELSRVTLATGERLTATDDHPFFVREGGERVERATADLEPGDRVYVPRDIESLATDGGVVATDDDHSTGPEVTCRRVASVEPVSASNVDDCHVYDLTVAGTHNFVANGMVVHNSEDRSAMHQALEQQEISVSKAGINATLKSRCSLLGAANPRYGRFDPYEPLGEQIDLEPALISRFDLIFTVQDKPDEEHDANLADHILNANYAGELSTQRDRMANPEFDDEEIASVTAEVEPAIEPELFRKYIAYAKRECFPSMSEGARERIKEFYVDLRAKGTDEDAPVPITARKLEALVRLAEASARVRLSDTVTEADAERVVELVRSCLKDIGVDPETGEFDADVVETGTSKTQRDRIKNVKALIEEIEDEYEEGAPVEEVLARADEAGIDRSKAEGEIENLKKKGELYEPSLDHLRTT